MCSPHILRAETPPHAGEISLSSAETLTTSLLAALSRTSPASDLKMLHDVLTRADDPTIKISNLSEFQAALPLPSETVLRVLDDFQHKAGVSSRNLASVFSGGLSSASLSSADAPSYGYSAYHLALQASVRQMLIQHSIKSAAQNRSAGPRTDQRQDDPPRPYSGLNALSLSALPLPPAAPLPPLPPVSPLATGLGGISSVGALSPLASMAVAGSAVAVTAGMASSGGDSSTAPVSSGGSGGSGGGSGGGGSDENLDTAVWETTEYNRNWGLGAINASTAYARGYTGDNVTVSVLDSPFDTDHAEFSGQLTTAYDALDGDSAVSCPVMGCVSSHGTHVAGTIGASKDNTGMHGVAPDVTIKPVKIFGNDLSFVNSGQLVNAIGQGSGPAITAMNNSWGASTIDTLVHNSTTYYYKRPFYNYPATNTSELSLGSAERSAWQTATQDTIIVFANGNDGLNTETGQIALYSDAAAETFSHYANNTATDLNANVPSYRGSLPSVDSTLAGEWLTVVAVQSDNTIASFSNGCGHARDYCIAAPGVAIYSTYDVDDNSSASPVSYANLQGTSMAAPHVTGALALLKQQFPNLSPSQLTSLVLSTATDLGASGTDDVYGVGLLNLAEASQPQGGVSIAGADGSAIPSATMTNTALTASPAFGQALSSANISLGVTDSYQRSYEWNPSVTASEDRYRFSERELLALLETAPQKPLLKTHRAMLVGNLGSGDGDGSQRWLELSYRGGGSVLSVGGGTMAARTPMAAWSSSSAPAVADSAFSHLRTGDMKLRYMDMMSSLSPYLFVGVRAVSGEWNAGQRFREVSTQLHWQAHSSSLTSRFGILKEENTLLGAAFSGFYETRPVSSRFFSLSAEHPLAAGWTMGSSYRLLNSDVATTHSEFVRIDGVSADSYELFVTKSDPEAAGLSKRLSLRLPLATTDGTFSQTTTKGYDDDGNYQTVTDRFSLKNPARQLDLDFTHRQTLQTGGDWMVMMRASENAGGMKGRRDIGMYFGLKQSF